MRRRFPWIDVKSRTKETIISINFCRVTVPSNRVKPISFQWIHESFNSRDRIAKLSFPNIWQIWHLLKKKWLCIIELWLIDHKFNSISMELILLTKRNTSRIHVQGNEHVFNHTSLTYNLEFLDQIYALKLRNPNLCDYHTNSIEYHQFLQTL